MSDAAIMADGHETAPAGEWEGVIHCHVLDAERAPGIRNDFAFNRMSEGWPKVLQKISAIAAETRLLEGEESESIGGMRHLAMDEKTGATRESLSPDIQGYLLDHRIGEFHDAEEPGDRSQ